MLSSLKALDKRVIIGVDVGTSNIKCCAYDRFKNVLGKTDEEITSIYNNDGSFEIDPDELWRKFTSAVDGCLLSSSLHANQVASMGISTQRGTFLTWDRETGQPFHNFISWKDKTSQNICDRWNSSILMKFLQFGALLIHAMTFLTKFQVYSQIKFSPAMVLPRLYMILNEIPEMRQKCEQGRVLFGTIDTWLLWKLTGGRIHATDSSNACVTGFFDHFQMKWSSLILKAFGIPIDILPEVKNTSDSYGETLQSIFGSPIPICCLVGDQQASMFGACCFKKHDINCTMGTGSFLTINTGDKPSYTYPGFFPLVGWTIDCKTTYIAECGAHNTGPAVRWMQSLGFIEDPSDSSRIAQSVEDTRGVYFMPTEKPLQMSNDGKFTFINMNLNIKKEHLVRSVLESLSFQVGLLFDMMNKVFGKKRNTVKICGGVSKNDFVVQLVSDITDRRLERIQFETSSLGAAFLAGLHVGFWTLEDFKDIEIENDVFIPSTYVDVRLDSFTNWKRILDAGSFKS